MSAKESLAESTSLECAAIRHIEPGASQVHRRPWLKSTQSYQALDNTLGSIDNDADSRHATLPDRDIGSLEDLWSVNGRHRLKAAEKRSVPCSGG